MSDDAAFNKLVVMMERVLEQVAKNMEAKRKKDAASTDAATANEVPQRGGYPRPFVS